MCFFGALFLFSFNFIIFFKSSSSTEKVIFYLLTCCLTCPVQCVLPPPLFHTVMFFVFVVEGHVSCVPLWLHGLLVLNVLLVRIGKMTIVTVEYSQHLIIINIMTKQCCCLSLRCSVHSRGNL